MIWQDTGAGLLAMLLPLSSEPDLPPKEETRFTRLRDAGRAATTYTYL